MNVLHGGGAWMWHRGDTAKVKGCLYLLQASLASSIKAAAQE